MQQVMQNLVLLEHHCPIIPELLVLNHKCLQAGGYLLSLEQVNTPQTHVTHV